MNWNSVRCSDRFKAAPNSSDSIHLGAVWINFSHHIYRQTIPKMHRCLFQSPHHPHQSRRLDDVGDAAKDKYVIEFLQGKGQLFAQFASLDSKLPILYCLGKSFPLPQSTAEYVCVYKVFAGDTLHRDFAFPTQRTKLWNNTSVQ